MVSEIDTSLDVFEESKETIDSFKTFAERRMITLYHHVIKYMCQQRIQSRSHITTIIRICSDITNKSKKLKKDDKTIHKALKDVFIKNDVLSKAIDETRDEAMKSRKNFTRPMDRTDIMAAFPLSAILDKNKMESFFKEYAVADDIRLKFNLKELDESEKPPADILPGQA